MPASRDDQKYISEQYEVCRKIAMADPTELNRLRAMITQFRVSELTSLLQSQSRPKTGRKRELLDRSLDLLRGPGPISEDLKRKIIELDSTRNPSASRYTGMSNEYSHQYHDYSSVAPSYGGGFDQSYGQPKPEPKPEAGVKFRPLAFYDQIEPVLRTSKIPGNGSRGNGTTFYIRIEKPDMEKFVSGQSAKREQYTFLLRFADLSGVALGKNILSDDIPSSMKLKINDKDAELPPHIPPSKAGVEPKRQKKPVIITPQIRSDISRAVSSGAPHVFIQITASWKDEDNKAWGICCDLSEQLPVETVLERVERSRVSKAETTEIIKEKLDPDEECAMTNLKVSLQCPVGQSRMKMPTRTRKCNHLQCFDANLYLRMNEKKPTWNCPVCDIEAYFNELVVDDYFVEICGKSGTDEIEFIETGEWREFKPKKDREPKKERKPPTAQIVNLDDSDDENCAPSSPPHVTNGHNNNADVVARVDQSVICISSDDEDESSPQPKRLRLGGSGSTRVPSLPNGDPNQFGNFPSYYGHGSISHSKKNDESLIVIDSDSDSESCHLMHEGNRGQLQKVSLKERSLEESDSESDSSEWSGEESSTESPKQKRLFKSNSSKRSAY